MTVKELKEKLLLLPEDMEVFVYADHGQSPYSAESAGEHFIESLEYGADLIHPEDAKDCTDLETICLISD